MKGFLAWLKYYSPMSLSCYQCLLLMEEIQSQASERSHPVSFCSAKTPTEGHPRGPSLLLFLNVQSLPMFFLGSELCSGELWDNSSGPIDLCQGRGWSWTCKILQDRPLPVSGTRWNTFSCKGFQHGGFCRHACSHTSSTSPERGEEAVTCHCRVRKQGNPQPGKIQEHSFLALMEEQDLDISIFPAAPGGHRHLLGP